MKQRREKKKEKHQQQISFVEKKRRTASARYEVNKHPRKRVILGKKQRKLLDEI